MPTFLEDTHRRILGFFNHAQIGTINGGNFTLTVHNNAPKDPTRYLKYLYGKVAANAILNKGGRADPVRCHPGTRKEVLTRIDRWRTTDYRSDYRPFWLSGPAGSGKSAIVQTVAEYCLEHSIPMASFFFFRTDGTRNHSQALVATLLYQLFDTDPSLKDRVGAIIEDNPFIINESIHDQFSQLLNIPVRQSDSLMQRQRPIVLLIDGLDECEPKESQAVILRALHILVASPNSPFIALVASRTEHQITRSFNQLGSFSDSIFLDDSFQPYDDIRQYLEAQFLDIKHTHPLRRFLASDWPSHDAINRLVEKSSGQFIYAATVARYVSESSASPRESLHNVISIASIGNNKPFAPLDGLYTHILSQAKDVDGVLELLAAYVISDLSTYLPVRQTLALLGYSSEIIASRLADMSALVKVEGMDSENRGNVLKFYHASFSDFLLDKGRSKGYCPDYNTMASKIFLLHMQRQTQIFIFSAELFIDWVTHRNAYIDAALRIAPLRLALNTEPDQDNIIPRRFLENINAVYQHDPVFQEFFFQRWAAILLTVDHYIGYNNWQRALSEVEVVRPT